jgi:murein DD-endopeptidase MepM/ murein hydrolase activator NlpD
MDSLSQASVVLGQELIEAFDIKDKLKEVVDGLGQISDLLQSEGLLGALDKLIGPETQTALAAIGGAILFSLIPAFAGLAAAIGAALLPLVPFIVAGMAVGVLTFVVVNKMNEGPEDQGGPGGGGGSISEWGDEVGNVEQMMGDNWKWFGSIVDTYIGQLVMAFDLIGGAIAYWLPRVGDALGQFAGLINSWVGNVVYFFDQVDKGFLILKDTYEYVFARFTDVSVGAGVDVSDLWLKVSAFVSGASADFTNWGNNVNGVFKWFAEMIEGAKTNINAGAEVIRKALDGAGEWWIDQFDTFVKFFTDFPEKAYQWGVDIITRLKDGIIKVKDDVTGAVADLVEDVKKKFLEGFGIHSPSDFMIYIADNLMSTLLDNLKGNELVQAVEGLVQQIKDAFNAGNFDLAKALAWLGNGAKDILAKIGISLPQLMGFLFPLDGEITSYFGNRVDPITGEADWHEGIDIAGNYGDPVKAAAAGIVSFAGWLGGYGNAVKIDHGGGLETLYGHLESIAVSIGQAVNAGDVIGGVGSTGYSTGPHLHWGVYQDGNAIDPMTANFGTMSAGGDLAQWITAAINATGVGMENFQHLWDLAMAESSGNPNAINDWDSNWYAGTPSMGLMQTIQSTFDAYALPGYGDIWNPIANAIAAIRYMLDVYGSIAATPLTGYETGTDWVPRTGPYILHEGEAVLTKEQNSRHEARPILIQLVLENSKAIAEFIIDDIDLLGGERTKLKGRGI